MGVGFLLVHLGSPDAAAQCAIPPVRNRIELAHRGSQKRPARKRDRDGTCNTDIGSVSECAVSQKAVHRKLMGWLVDN